MSDLPRRWPLLVGLFARYVRRYLARHLHAVRLAPPGWRPPADEGPVILVLNHPSWWDPLVCAALTGLFPGREHYAPIEASALARYRFFEWLGFFGVEPGTVHGALTFLRRGRAVLARPQSVLWVTAQGRFADPRERPPGLQSGVGHLAARLDRGVILPLALEYPFWTERTAEALARFGDPIPLGGRRLTPAAWTALVEQAVQATQDLLARDACRREPAAFEVLLSGNAGVGGVYDLWRGLRARLRGERFRAEHGAHAGKEAAECSP
jgi:1-acyl-sn-glycerol-3-phosphate acyltransferase